MKEFEGGRELKKGDIAPPFNMFYPLPTILLL